MPKLPSCGCHHLGHCPFEGNPGPDRTDLDGKLLWRPLAPEEDPRVPQRGDLCGVGDDGQTYVVARAVDPEHVMAYGRSKEGRRCRGQSWLWCHRYPVPIAKVPERE